MKSIPRIWLRLSLLNVALVLLSSLLGIFSPKTYALETANWAQQAVGQDIGNLLAVFALGVSVWMSRKGNWRAEGLWLGVHLYFIYAFLLYAFFVHFNPMITLYVPILGLSTFCLLGGLHALSVEKRGKFLAKRIAARKLAAAVLIATGALFGLLWLAEITPALLAGENTPSAIEAGLWTNPVHVIDLAWVLPGMIFTGVMLYKKKAIGYFLAAPWLGFSVLMGSSILALMLIQLIGGNEAVLPPLLMVGLVVLLSAGVLYVYLFRRRG